MQGRLCDQVDGKIQCFPWKDWEKEFIVAGSIGVHLMEWTLDLERVYENPILTVDGQKKIKNLCAEFGINIPSLTGDCFMHAPFWKCARSKKNELKSLFLEICQASAIVGVRKIVVPLVDNGRLESNEQEDELLDFLLLNSKTFNKLGIQIIFESDFNPAELNQFIQKLPTESFGINYDIGNSASLGFNPLEEFTAYGKRVLNVHVKDRLLGGTTVPLNKGAAKFVTVFEQLAKINYSGNFILQTARAMKGEHARVLSEYISMTNMWIENTKQNY